MLNSAANLYLDLVVLTKRRNTHTVANVVVPVACSWHKAIVDTIVDNDFVKLKVISSSLGFCSPTELLDTYKIINWYINWLWFAELSWDFLVWGLVVACCGYKLSCVHWWSREWCDFVLLRTSDDRVVVELLWHKVIQFSSNRLKQIKKIDPQALFCL